MNIGNDIGNLERNIILVKLLHLHIRTGKESSATVMASQGFGEAVAPSWAFTTFFHIIFIEGNWSPLTSRTKTVSSCCVNQISDGVWTLNGLQVAIVKLRDHLAHNFFHKTHSESIIWLIFHEKIWGKLCLRWSKSQWQNFTFRHETSHVYNSIHLHFIVRYFGLFDTASFGSVYCHLAWLTNGLLLSI